MKLKVLIQPNAKKNEVVGTYDDSVKIKIKAPPVDGEANETLIKFLSELLRIPRKSIQILHGHTGKNKLIEIETSQTTEEITEFLLAADKIS